MNDKGKGFMLTPSRLGKPAVEVAKPVFTGLKQSKLGGSVGILADSKLSVLQSQSNSSNTESEESASSAPFKPTTFSFTPLSKPGTENSENSFLGTATEKKTEGDGKSSEIGVKTAAPVFGQNLSEKAIVPAEKSQEEKIESADTTELLFSSVPAAEKLPEEDKKTLSESAAEYTESHKNKRKYEEVTVVTGEEEECNVMQSNVKLYLFCTENKNWVERSRGLIRLNDATCSKLGHIRSRLVMRTSGSLRVVLNTKLWAGMVCEKVNDKNIRISAWDEDVVRIFLISGSPKDAEKLHQALECRINQLKHEKDVEEGMEGGKMEGQDKETLHTESAADTKEENDEPSPKKIARTEDSASSSA